MSAPFPDPLVAMRHRTALVGLWTAVACLVTLLWAVGIVEALLAAPGPVAVVCWLVWRAWRTQYDDIQRWRYGKRREALRRAGQARADELWPMDANMRKYLDRKATGKAFL